MDCISILASWSITSLGQRTETSSPNLKYLRKHDFTARVKLLPQGRTTEEDASCPLCQWQQVSGKREVWILKYRNPFLHLSAWATLELPAVVQAVTLMVLALFGSFFLLTSVNPFLFPSSSVLSQVSAWDFPNVESMWMDPTPRELRFWWKWKKRWQERIAYLWSVCLMCLFLFQYHNSEIGPS